MNYFLLSILNFDRSSFFVKASVEFHFSLDLIESERSMDVVFVQINRHCSPLEEEPTRE